MAPFCLHLLHCVLVHLDIPVDHHFLEENEVFHGQDLLEKTLVDALLSSRLRHDKVLWRDTQILNVRLQFLLDEVLELLVYSCKLQGVLLSVFEDYAFLFDEANDRVLPHGRLEKLRHDLQDPFLDAHNKYEAHHSHT